MKRNSFVLVAVLLLPLAYTQLFQNCIRINSKSISIEGPNTLRQMPFSCEDSGPRVEISSTFVGMGLKEASTAFDINWVLTKLSDAGVESVVLPFNEDIVRKVTSHGIRPVVVLGLPERTDGSSPTDPFSSQDLTNWENNLISAVSSHSELSSVPINDWKFHNEPNGTQYWQQSRDAYIQLFKRFYEVVKSTNPKVRVWGPGVVYHLNNQTPGPQNPDDWVDDIISKAKFDVFSIHIYVSSPVDVRTITRKVKDKLAHNNMAAQLALTEVSIWTPQNNCNFYGQTPEQQKTYLERVYACAAEGGANTVYWFTSTDRKAPTSGTNSGCPDGWIPNGVFLRHPNLAEKPSYRSLMRIGTDK